MSWLDDLVVYAQSQLGNREREALLARGVSEDQIVLYRIGCLRQALPSVGISKEFWAFSKGGQRLTNVFVLPLTNVLGQIKGLQFRHVDRAHGGYLTFYQDRDESVYFGLGQAMPKIWESEAVWLVEGAFDVFPIQRVFENTFAALTLGTSEALARLLRKFAKQVWLAYDNDKDGREACRDFARDYGSFLDVRIPVFPRIRLGEKKFVKDPNELWEVWGDTKFREHLLRQVNPYMNMEKSHA
jgi:DNA primase